MAVHSGFIKGNCGMVTFFFVYALLEMAIFWGVIFRIISVQAAHRMG
jgi:hypothetical protein